MALGLALSGRGGSSVWPRALVAELHRFASLWIGLLVTLHVAAIAVDRFVPFSLLQLVVPFTAGYRPLFTGLGVVAAELLVLVAVTNALRRRIGTRLWRRTHLASYGVWAAATAHGIGAGTDRGQPALEIVYATAIVTVALLSAWRLSALRVRTT